MANFDDMKINLNKSLKIIKINGKDVNVLQYLPAEEKNSILENVIQQADQGTILNTFLLDCIFDMYLIFSYTDIKFTDEQKNNILDTYDLLESNGLVDIIIAAIPENEYNILRDNLQDMVDDYLGYRNSARALLKQFEFFAPDAAEKLKEATKDLDVEKLKDVLQLAGSTGINNAIGQY